jgi:hypothetical protein
MKIEFVIATHKYVDHLKGMIACLKAQTSPDWVAHIVCDGNNWEIRDYNSSELCLLPNVKFREIGGPNGDWGHTALQMHKRFVTEELLCMTSDDNYYVPSFVAEMLEAFKDPKVAFAYCDMIHNAYGYNLVKTKLKLAHIDLGCFVTRSHLARQIRLGKGYEDDYWFAHHYTRTFCSGTYKIKKIKKPLYVHN